MPARNHTIQKPALPPTAILIAAVAGTAVLAGVIVSFAVSCSRAPKPSAGAWTNYVSLVQLLANPKEFDGRRVAVAGYAAVEFENNALYLHKEDRDWFLTKNALWVDYDNDKVDERDRKACNGKYVVLTGTFRAEDLGHVEGYSGTITRAEPVLLPAATNTVTSTN